MYDLPMPGDAKTRPLLASPRDFLTASGLALIIFALYLRTLAPTVLYYSPENFDSAHLQVAAYVLGIPSYTGYPTYIILAHLFTYLPFGEVAWRVNLASAVFGAATIFTLFFVAGRLGAGRFGAAVGAVALGVGATVWSQAVIAEVYTLHLLLSSVFLLALLVWRDTGRDAHLVLAVFLGGLALTNHLTSMFLLPAGAVFVALILGRRAFRPARLLACAGAFLIGLSPYLYLPIRAMMEPPLLGAGPQPDPSTFSGFYELVSGGEFKGSMFVFGPGELLGRLSLYGDDLARNLGPSLVVVAVVGVFVLARRDVAACVLLALVFLLNLGYALEYEIEDVEIYFIPTYLVLSLLLTVGTGVLTSFFSNRKYLRYGLSLGLAALVIIGIPGSYLAGDRSNDDLGRTMISAVEENVAPGSTVLVHGRTLDYMQLVEGDRRDIALEDPFYSNDWVGRAERGLQRGPVYVMYPGATNARLLREAGYELSVVEDAMLYRVIER
ncbi:MAG: glycosyltransferase family 117 protein [Rubrobacter sp.]